MAAKKKTTNRAKKKVQEQEELVVEELKAPDLATPTEKAIREMRRLIIELDYRGGSMSEALESFQLIHNAILETYTEEHEENLERIADLDTRLDKEEDLTLKLEKELEEKREACEEYASELLAARLEIAELKRELKRALAGGAPQVT